MADDKDMKLLFKMISENKDKFADLFSDDSKSETTSVTASSVYGDSASKPDDLSQELLKELECPVCLEYMIPPITMCINGHNICSTCRSKLNKCPTCRKQFLKVRNKALEKLVQKVDCPCKNATFGCKMMFPPGLIQEHETICLHRPYKCPLSVAEGINCDWESAYGELRAHIETKHKGRLTVITDLKNVVMNNFNPTKKYSRIIFACQEIFYQQFEVIDDVFYFVIQHIGHENCALKYRYTYGMSTEHNIEVVFFAFIARSCKVDIKDLHQSGQCVKLHYNTVQNFMEGTDNLSFTFDITRANGKRTLK